MPSRRTLNYQTYYKLVLWFPLVLAFALIFASFFFPDQHFNAFETVLMLTYFLSLFGGMQYLACIVYALYQLKRSRNKKEMIKTLYYLPLIFSFLLMLTIAYLTMFHIKTMVISAFIALCVSYIYLGLCELSYFLCRNFIDDDKSK